MGDLESAIPKLLPEIASVRAMQPVGGGCISDAMSVSVSYADGRHDRLFVKSNQQSFLDNFHAESDGLQRLRQPSVIGVPQPLAVGAVAGRAYLITEWIDAQRGGDDFFDAFGRALAQLHRVTLGTEIGLERDNYLGAARQINTATPTWNEFVAVNRLQFQIRWAVDQGLADRSLQQHVQRIIDSIDAILDGRDEATSLLHGDLWSGNYLSAPDGQPTLIDPAIYHGCREAEFGMLKLFGSCPARFYEAYLDQFPLPDGWQRRVGVYVLYHLLNHLNLFGRGYHGQCQSLAAEIQVG